MQGNSVQKLLEFSIKADLQHEMIEAHKLGLCETPAQIIATMETLADRMEFLTSKYRAVVEQLKHQGQ